MKEDSHDVLEPQLEVDAATIISMEGYVEKILFSRADAAFYIFKLNTGDKVESVTGTVPNLKEGDTLRVYGVWAEHTKYGPQLKLTDYELLSGNNTNVEPSAPPPSEPTPPPFEEDVQELLAGFPDSDFPPEEVSMKGVVNRILFHNEENFYCVFKLKVGNKMESAVGYIPDLKVTEKIHIKGSWTEHQKYGKQVKVTYFERVIPKENDEIIAYLNTGTVEGVTNSLSIKMVEAFGSELFHIMEHEPSRLTEISSITDATAKTIGDSYKTQLGTQKLMTFLLSHNLPASLVGPLTKFFGEKALSVVETNPYVMVGEDFGLNFNLADGLAKILGKSSSDSSRLEAGMIHALTNSFQDGHCFLPKKQLMMDAARVLQCNYEELEPIFKSLVETSALFYNNVNGVDAAYLPTYQEGEEDVALRMLEMCDHETLPPDNLEELIEKIQEEQGISYSEEQKNAVVTAANNQIMILTGGPGTGKTTCLKGVLALFQALDLETSLAAPTGRAAHRMSELCGKSASTIHRLLEIGIDDQTGRMVFQRDGDEPLKAKAVIVDETSMVDITLMSALVSALSSDCRLILVGDPDQLPSVSPGNVFSDLIYSDKIPKVRLTEIFRQAEESNIVKYAHKVNHGEVSDMKEKQGDFFFLPRNSKDHLIDTIVNLCNVRLPAQGYTPDQIQVLTPTHKNGGGTKVLNLALQAALNPPSEEKNEKKHLFWTFREGDRVMQTKNNYDLSWTEVASEKTGKGVFNGDIGTVKTVSVGAVFVDFDGKLVEYTQDLLIQLEPAYAVTVHKAQGSEYPALIFAAFEVPNPLKTRDLLYTGITRAKDIFILVGETKTITEMIINEKRAIRYSGLKARLQGTLTEITV